MAAIVGHRNMVLNAMQVDLGGIKRQTTDPAPGLRKTAEKTR
jgi:hypothetical protein